MPRSGRLMIAFVINMGAVLFNLALALVYNHNGNFEMTVLHGAFVAFNGIIAIVTLFFFFDVKFQEDMEQTRRRIYGDRYPF